MLKWCSNIRNKRWRKREIGELVGEDNIYFFGESSEQVIEHYKKCRLLCKKITTQKDEDIHTAVDFLISEQMLEAGDEETLTQLHKELINKRLVYDPP